MATLYETMGNKMPAYGTAARTALAVAAGIPANQYTGTASQNAKIVAYLQNTPAIASPSAPATGKSDPNQPYTDQQYTDALNNNAIVQAHVKAGNTAEDIANAASTGDFSGLVNSFGQPFSLQEQQDALAQAEKDTAAYYDQQKAKDQADTEAALADKQRQYQDYLITSGQNFSADKATADKTAADNGVLFSGSRVQKENDLKTKYEQDQASKRAGLATDMGNTARDFQYKYGNDAASSLSSLYNLGSNTYDPKVATGGVGSTGLSSIYNPSIYNFGGTAIAERKAAAQKRAAGMLANRGNKLLSTSYANQL